MEGSFRVHSALAFAVNSREPFNQRRMRVVQRGVEGVGDERQLASLVDLYQALFQILSIAM